MGNPFLQHSLHDTKMDKKIENLGQLKGKILLFGGVYSNFQALEKLKSISEKEHINAENCICTGDIVGYCAQPEESVQLFKMWGAKSIAGNVEIQLKEGSDNCGCDFSKGSRCDSFSEQWYPFAQSKLSQNSLDFIKSLPDHLQFKFGNKKITVVHGSYFHVSEFIFKSTPWNLKQPNFTATNSDVIIGGHCGLPFHDEADGLHWLNPGVIGMPANDGQPHVWYAILEIKRDIFSYSFHCFDYDHNLTSELMRQEPLPKEYEQTIRTGIWDNTEILPEPESLRQGFELKL